MSDQTAAEAGSRQAVDYGTCPACGHLMVPVLPLSPCGHEEEPVVSPLAEPGTVYSWTRTDAGGPARTIVMADFLDGRLRVTAPLLGPDVDIGDGVWLTVGEDTPYALTSAG